jgi:hypothetical protein
MAEEEARMMRVEPDKLTQSAFISFLVFVYEIFVGLVMLMGYTTTEARRGLRSSQGNIDQAIEFIIEVKKEILFL